MTTCATQTCMRRWKLGLFMPLLLLSLAPSATPGHLSSWHRVLVSWNTLSNIRRDEIKVTVTVPEGTNRVLYCSRECGSLPWCSVWCLVPHNENKCRLLRLRVLPGYKEVEEDIVSCYTSLTRDLATGANITSGIAASNRRIPENLVDGFYSFAIDECFKVDRSVEDTWFVIDFKAVVKVSRVILHAQNNNYVYKMFNQVEVRTGTTLVAAPENLRLNYTLFGTFEGPATRAQVVEFASPDGKARVARYLSVEQVAEGQTAFQVCHVEVY